MTRYNLLFESSPWLIGIGIVIGALYAVGLYYRYRGPWGRNIQILLAFVRFLLVTQLTLLLFGPLVRQVKNTYEPPAIVLALDNSASVELGSDSLELELLYSQLQDLAGTLEKQGYVTEVRSLSGIENDIGSGVGFSEKSTDINTMLRGIQNDFESRNLKSVVLVSDGLYNLGINPNYYPYNFRISTVGLGDTIRKPDVNLNALLYNSIAYQGNKFPIVAELITHGMMGQQLTVRLISNGKTLETKQVTIGDEEQFDQVRFLVEAEKNGTQRYTVRVAPVEGEFTQVNNYKDAFIDIIEGRERILFAAPSPHPDIKAIRQTLEKNDNYEITLYIPSISTFKKEPYDLVFLYQVPDVKDQFGELIRFVEAENLPVFYVLGSKSDIPRFNQQNGILQIQLINQQSDQVFPYFNANFSLFKYSVDQRDILNDYPPVRVPFANFSLEKNSEIMLLQQVGNIRTSKPLLVMQSYNGRKKAVLLGEGIWRWRLHEFAANENHQAFDEMISKVVQFLGTKEDRRRFKAYPLKNEYFDNETVVFETEAYNDIYEQIYGQQVSLIISDESGNKQGFTYATSESNTRYRINGLDQGIYNYTASSIVNGISMMVSGTFTIRELQIETTKLTADHNLLRNLASDNDGIFYLPVEMENLKEDLLNLEMKSKISTAEDYMAIINMKWGFFILIAFAALEWFIRKYMGSY
jgi:hypothetical protein